MIYQVSMYRNGRYIRQFTVYCDNSRPKHRDDKIKALIKTSVISKMTTYHYEYMDVTSFVSIINPQWNSHLIQLHLIQFLSFKPSYKNNKIRTIVTELLTSSVNSLKKCSSVHTATYPKSYSSKKYPKHVWLFL